MKLRRRPVARATNSAKTGCRRLASFLVRVPGWRQAWPKCELVDRPGIPGRCSKSARVEIRVGMGEVLLRTAKRRSVR